MSADFWDLLLQFTQMTGVSEKTRAMQAEMLAMMWRLEMNDYERMKMKGQMEQMEEEVEVNMVEEEVINVWHYTILEEEMEEEIEINTVEDEIGIDVWYIEERDLEEYCIVEEMYEEMELDEYEYEEEQEGKPVCYKNPWASNTCKMRFGAKQNLKASFAGGVKAP